MGHAERNNPTARDANAGRLMSRQTMMGAMDHALEMHASALRLLEAKIVALKERIEKMEARFHPVKTPGFVKFDQELDAAFAEEQAARIRQAETSGVESKSAQPCGCDAGARLICERHAREAYADTD